MIGAREFVYLFLIAFFLMMGQRRGMRRRRRKI
jgi:hypothetical protein